MSDWKDDSIVVPKGSSPSWKDESEVVSQKTSDGSDPDAAMGADVFGDFRSRMASGFGNDSGVGKALISKGFVDAKRNSAGDLVFKKAGDGKWYKDQDNFFKGGEGLKGYLPEHPINWAESHVGAALPVMGMGVGATLGGAADIPTGVVPGAVAGGAAGAMGGEGLRQATGRMLGTYDAGPVESAIDTAKEGAFGGLGEAIPLGAAKALGINPSLAAKPLMQSAESGPIGSGIKKGVSWVSEKMSGTPKEAVERLIERPTQVLNAENEGNALNVANHARQELLNRDSAEGAASSNARKTFRDQFGNERPDTSPITGKADQFLADKAPNPQGLGPLSAPESKEIGALSEKIKGMNAGDLQKTADFLDTQIKTFDQSKLPGTGDTPRQSFLRSLYRQIKGKLHEIDPKGLGEADAQFTDYANKAGRLGKLENEDQMEGFVNNYFGKNKTLMRESAKDLIPNSVEGIADIGASRAFTRQGPAGSEMGGRRILGSGVGALLGTHGMMTHNPIEILTGAVAHLGTSPGVHKQVIGRASQFAGTPWMQAFIKNPQLVESITNPSLKATIQDMLTKDLGVQPQYASDKENRSTAGTPGDTEVHDHTDPKNLIDPDEARRQFREGN